MKDRPLAGWLVIGVLAIAASVEIAGARIRRTLETIALWGQPWHG